MDLIIIILQACTEASKHQKVGLYSTPIYTVVSSQPSVNPLVVYYHVNRFMDYQSVLPSASSVSSLGGVSLPEYILD